VAEPALARRILRQAGPMAIGELAGPGKPYGTDVPDRTRALRGGVRTTRRGALAPTRPARLARYNRTLLSLTVIEQTGWGVLATALNLVYFTGITVVGGLTARGTHHSTALYDTVAVLNVIGVLAVGSAALLVTRRSRVHALT
jgi:hypothetical protein